MTFQLLQELLGVLFLIWCLILSAGWVANVIREIRNPLTPEEKEEITLDINRF